MIHLLLIADQHRLHDLFADSAERPDTVVSIATSLDTGIELISSASPDLVFVQSRLSGLSGEIIMRHVTAHLAPTSQVVLFSEGGKDSFGDVLEKAVTLDLTLSDRQLGSDISALIDKQLGSKPIHKTAAATHELPTEEDFIPTPIIALEPPPTPAPVTTRSEPEPTEPIPEPPVLPPAIATRFEAELEAELARHEPAPTLEPIAADRPMTLAQLEEITSATLDPYQHSANSSTVRRLAPWLLAGAVLFVLVSAGGYLLGKRTADRLPETPPKGRSPAKKVATPPKPAATPATPVKPLVPAPAATAVKPEPAPTATPAPIATPLPAQPKPQSLPSFVPREGLEPSYSISHPGWERYLDRDREYKIFREQDRLRAIQIIDRSGKGLTPQLFSKVLQELANVRDYKLASREVKGEYLVKKGRLSPTSQVIIYKNKADDKLQAFVIAFD